MRRNRRAGAGSVRGQPDQPAAQLLAERLADAASSRPSSYSASRLAVGRSSVVSTTQRAKNAHSGSSSAAPSASSIRLRYTRCPPRPAGLAGTGSTNADAAQARLGHVQLDHVERGEAEHAPAVLEQGLARARPGRRTGPPTAAAAR